MGAHLASRAAFVLALASAAMSFAPDGRAAALVNQGIGISACAKLGPDIKPEGGLDHLPNALLFYWVQGYVSAANVYLLNQYTNHVDLSQVTDKKIIQLVADFCKANPDKKPIDAIDEFIRDAKKVKVKEDDVFDPWEQ